MRFVRSGSLAVSVDQNIKKFYLYLPSSSSALQDINDFTSASVSLTDEMEKLIGDCSSLSHPYAYLRARFGPIDWEGKTDDDSDDEWEGMFSGFNKRVSEERMRTRKALFGVLLNIDQADWSNYILKMTNTTKQ